MDIFDRVNGIIGDSFFFKAFENTIEKELIKKYNVSNITKDFIFNDDKIDRLYSSLMPHIFDIEPKMVILRNVNTRFLSYALDSLKSTENVYLLIENEGEKPDGRSKVFKVLGKNDCLLILGVPYCNNDNIEIAFDEMEEMINYKIDNNIRNFFKKTIPKKEYNNKPIYNLNRIYNEIHKIFMIDHELSLDLCKNMVVKHQEYQNIFDITQALADKNCKKCIDIIDYYITDINSAKYILNFIESELKIICSLYQNNSKNFENLYQNININIDKYGLIDVENDKTEIKKIHPFRLKKILEKQNSDYYKNCLENLKLCMSLYNDLYYYYYDNYKIPVIKLCAQICFD